MHEEIRQMLEDGRKNRERRDQICRERGTTPPGGKWADGTPAIASREDDDRRHLMVRWCEDSTLA